MKIQARSLYPKRNKYGAVKCERDGIKFASKAERAYYDKLILLQKAEEVSFFLMQVPFRLPGGIVYRADFVIFYPNQSHCEVVDVKGFETPSFKLKKKLFESSYPLTIQVVK